MRELFLTEEEFKQKGYLSNIDGVQVVEGVYFIYPETLYEVKECL